MRLRFPRSILPVFAACGLFTWTASAQDDDKLYETPPSLEDHVIDAKVQEIIKNAKSTDEALRTLTQLVLQDPNNAELWYQIAEVCYKAHDTQRALSAYKKCIALDPARKGVWGVIGSLYYADGDKTKALDALKKALGFNPKDVDAMNTWAVILMDSGKLVDAQDMLDKAKATDPACEKVWNTSGMLFAKRQQWQDAVDAYTKAIELKPAYTIALFNRGSARIVMGDRPAAIADFQKITQTDPDYTMGWVALMQADWEAGHVDEAIAAGRAAVARYPDKAVLWEALGSAYTRARDESNALNALQRAKSLDPNLKNIESYIASAHAGGINLADAEAALKKAVAEKPNDGFSWGNLGELYLKRGKGPEAVTALENSAKFLPANAHVRRLLADAYLAVNENDHAKAALDKAVELGDNSPELWFAYGMFYKKAGNTAESLKDFEVAVKMNPRNGVFWANLADLRRAGKDLDGALAAAQEAVRLAPSQAAAYLALGNACEALQKSDEAAAAFKIARELNPGPRIPSAGAPSVPVKILSPEESIADYQKVFADPRAGVEEWFAAGRDLFNSKQFPEAEAAFRKVTEMSPRNPNALTMLGLSLMNEKKLDDAPPLFQKALDVNPAFPRALQGMAVCQGILKHFAEAEAAAAKYVAIDPDSQEIWNVLLNSCISEKKWTEADEYARKAKESHPEWVFPWLADGYALGAMKQTDQAVASFQMVAELEPKNAWGFIGIGRLYADAGQIEKSIAPFQRATEIDPANPSAWNCLGYSNFVLGRVDEAITLYQKSIACNATAVDAWVNLARAYARQNDAGKTGETCDRIAVFNPDLARQLRAELNVK